MSVYDLNDLECGGTNRNRNSKRNSQSEEKREIFNLSLITFRKHKKQTLRIFRLAYNCIFNTIFIISFVFSIQKYVRTKLSVLCRIMHTYYTYIIFYDFVIIFQGSANIFIEEEYLISYYFIYVCSIRLVVVNITHFKILFAIRIEIIKGRWYLIRYSLYEFRNFHYFVYFSYN